MAAVTICNDLDPKKIKSVTVSVVSPSIYHEVMGPDAMIFVCWILSLKPTFSLSSFTFIKTLFSSSSLSAIREVLYQAFNPSFRWQPFKHFEMVIKAGPLEVLFFLIVFFSLSVNTGLDYFENSFPIKKWKLQVLTASNPKPSFTNPPIF